MNVNSTKFQQNVGYYLKLAEAGTVVNIVRSKPKYCRYELKFIEEPELSPTLIKLNKLFNKIEKMNNRFNFYGNDPVKYVRNLRK